MTSLPETNGMFLSEADKAYRIIYDEIVSGKLPPGTKLSRRKMAALADVSVIPVIEALKQLESDGLVESMPKWGSYVTIPTKAKLDNQYILRETIECKVAQLLAEKGLSAEQEQRLRAIAAEADSAEPSPNRQAQHHNFHATLIEYTGYDIFADVMNRINLFFILCRATSTRRRRSQVPPDWHNRVVDAIVSGDSAGAQRVMKDHIYDSYQVILEEIEQYDPSASNANRNVKEST